MRRLQSKLYDILENPEAPLAGRLVNGFLIALIVANVVAATLFTVRGIALEHARLLYGFELFSVAVFTIEYVIRMWVCTLNPAYRRPVFGRIRYFFTIPGLVDLIAVLPFYLPMFIHADLLFLRALRLMRLLRLLKLGRYSESIRMIGTVVSSRKAELMVSVMMSVILLLIASSLMYYLENHVQPDVFSSVPAAMWWGVVTMTTVGYGDVLPVTPLGKILAGIIAILGISLFILPAGIIAAGYTEELRRKRSKRYVCPHCGNVIP